MNNKDVANEILKNVGGKENVTANVACMTRLRLGIKDNDKVNVDALKRIDGVLAVVQADTLQVVLGPGKVNKIAEPFADLTGVPLGSDADDGDVAEDSQRGEDVKDIAKENKKVNKAKHDKPLQRGLQHIANVFIPLLPGIIAAGLINGLANVIDYQTGQAFVTDWWYMTIKTLGWGLFTFLPIFVGMNAAREFKGSAILGGIGGTLCLGVTVTGSPLSSQAISMPFTHAPFTVGVGGLITALLMGIFFAFLERNFRKIMPSVLDTFFTPLLTVIVGSLIAVVFLQPAGAWLTTAIYVVMDFVYTKLSVFGGFILSSTFLALVSVGLHQALTPIHVLLNDPTGPTHGINYLLPILMMAGGGQVGAGFALYFKSKNKRFKKMVMSSIPVAILGVGEPLMYAVTLPLGRAFVTASIGAGFGGIVASLFHLGAVSQGVSGLFGLLIMQPGQQLTYLLALLVAYFGGFIVTWFFGVDENRINEIYPE
ncbi:PTS transporter subunit EIIC [Companilactobacillus nantensis]|uniref:PTS system sucrose-specific IIBC component n=1 Tax=Companilactobacillus nantensis DSM 16982 TaxID=1423774 RepID=A0A0R1WM54_9LACO|nr:PTS transporter subunit EIIC [Companilactobacillus nantensis]KRM16793.1 PTS system sucrose-specific IIBC component [Companilactobacillus nantensis DSM 16982]GEO64231.1 PTS trehalose transporter subunit IIBC [Companilactobacillus nantensis]